jgi:hypothetical protein
LSRDENAGEQNESSSDLPREEIAGHRKTGQGGNEDIEGRKLRISVQ